MSSRLRLVGRLEVVLDHPVKQEAARDAPSGDGSDLGDAHVSHGVLGLL